MSGLAATELAEKRALTLREAAAVTPFSEKQLRAAIHATKPDAWPPPLRAKVTARNRNGSPRGYVVLPRDLDAWLESFQDA